MSQKDTSGLEMRALAAWRAARGEVPVVGLDRNDEWKERYFDERSP